MKKILTDSCFVLGGANSGKSLFAENRVLSMGLPRTYIATAQVWDDEMRSKVSAHKSQRGPDWTTVEAPFDLAHAISNTPSDHVILLDCLTMWLTNLMLADTDIDAEIPAVLDAIKGRAGPTMIVSNEVGQGIVPDNAMARKFVAVQGRANQTFATACDTVVFVTAGLPTALKGTL